MCIALRASLPFCYRTGLGEVFFFSRTATAARIKPGASASEPQAWALLSPHLVTTAILPCLRFARVFSVGGRRDSRPAASVGFS